MISVSSRNWEQTKINQNLIDKIKQDHNFSNILSRLIITRNLDVDEITSINNTLKVNNVFVNNNMNDKSN